MKKLVILLLLLLVYLQYRLWFGEGSLQEVGDLQRAVELQREENLQLGLDAIEEHAREDLGMVKEGETFYQVVE
jgi:cell division protein FtsB